jgi:hypothetical protein
VRKPSETTRGAIRAADNSFIAQQSATTRSLRQTASSQTPVDQPLFPIRCRIDKRAQEIARELLFSYRR